MRIVREVGPDGRDASPQASGGGRRIGSTDYYLWTFRLSLPDVLMDWTVAALIVSAPVFLLMISGIVSAIRWSQLEAKAEGWMWVGHFCLTKPEGKRSVGGMVFLHPWVLGMDDRGSWEEEEMGDFAPRGLVEISWGWGSLGRLVRQECLTHDLVRQEWERSGHSGSAAMSDPLVHRRRGAATTMHGEGAWTFLSMPLL